MIVPEASANSVVASAVWDVESNQAVESFSSLVRWESLVLAFSSGVTPRADEVLRTAGVAGGVVRHWLNSADAASPPFEHAMKSGSLPLTPQESREIGLGDGVHGLILAQAASGRGPRWWWLVLGRAAEPFTDEERSTATMVLRQWEASFHQPPAPMVGRILLGADMRLMHADPGTHIQLIQSPGMLDRLVETLRVVVRQRWGEITLGRAYDFAIFLNRKSWWVRFHRVPLPESGTPGRWHLDLYRLEEDELPIVGELDDPRVAKAIGFIHNEFHRSPSLAEIAKAVDVSPYHFHRMFTGAVGVSPKYYLQRKQLQVARWLLRSTQLPVGRIAAAAGFASHGHFTSTFHRIVGVSPRVFRERG